MIYRLFRKEASVRGTLDLLRPELSESTFIEEISRMIKLLKRREKLYVELEQGKGGEEGQRENGELLGEAEAMLGILRGFSGESYFSCKAYLYTAFMRISEIADKGRTRPRNETRLLPDRNYEEMKRAITELYNRQANEEKYDVVELFQLTLRLQSQRIGLLLPKKKIAPLQPINNSTKILDQLRMPSGSIDLRKKSASTEMFKGPPIKLQQIVSKKLVVVELATSKRVEDRKKQKRPRVVNLFKLYDVLDIRPLPMDRPYTLKDELQVSMNERNQLVRDAIKQWQRRWATGVKGSRRQRSDPSSKQS